MFRIKGDPQIKNILKLYPVASTGGNVSSSDVGSLVVLSSGRGSLNRPSSDIFSLTTAGGYLPVAGILVGISESSGVDVGSTVAYLKVQPIAAGEVLEADYTTDTTFWTQANEYLVTTNLGNYLRVCGAGSSSSVGSTAGAITVGTTDQLPLAQSQYIDVSTGETAAASSYPFQLQNYSTKYKTVDVVLVANTTVFAGRAY